LRVVAGHGPESANLALLLPRVEAFYDAATSDGTRILLLDEFDVAYVFWGPEERMLGDWRPDQSGLMRDVIKVGEYEVFEIAAPQ
jgi:uncharacterized membrane protein